MQDIIDNTSLKDVVRAVSNWEEAVRWIERGWDCIDEYTHDLYAREMLAEVIDAYKNTDTLPDKLVSRVEAADQRFRAATENSGLCAWHTESQFRFQKGEVELCFKQYDPGQYWYYYRWQPDCPIQFREHDSINYQKEVFGMDFKSMTEYELKVAAKKFLEATQKQMDQETGHSR